MKRVVEDIAALSPEASQFGLAQQYLIANVGKSTDVFVNPKQFVYFDPNVAAGNPIDAASVAGTPCASSLDYGGTDPNVSAASVPFDSNFNPVSDSSGNNAFCILNRLTAGQAGADGVADGFVDPVRVYKAVEFEVNKSFSKNWQLRANYRIAKLYGNYEGLFRNDNGQSDPNITSLFDFTEGNFNLLGQQFASGVLNSDVRHTVNGFFSYTFGNHRIKGLTLGTALRYQTGFPINNLHAHPAYGNSGELPFCADDTVNCASARGALGRTNSFGSVDLSVRYPVRLSEKLTLSFLGDFFNITNNRSLLNVNQFHQTTIGIPNADFLKPAGFARNNLDSYQRPFHARFGLKLQF